MEGEDSGAEQRLSCPLCPESDVYTGSARELTRHQRTTHPGQGERLIRKLPTKLRVGYHVCSACLDIYAHSTRHAASCSKRHPESAPSQGGETGTVQPQGQKRAPKRRRTESPRIPDSGAPRPQRVAPPLRNTARVLPLAWGLEEVGLALDSISAEELTKLSFATVKEVRPQHRNQLGHAIQHSIRLFLRAHEELVLQRATGHAQPGVTIERAIKLLHLTPALLLSTDGRMSRQGRFNAFTSGDIGGLLSWLIMFSRRPGCQAREDSVGARQARATRLAHERGGITKAAMTLVSPPPSPRNEETLSILRNKHPHEDIQEILKAGEQMSQLASRPAQPDDPRISEVERPFDPEDIRATIVHASPQSSPGPSGLRYSHLQAANSVSLVEDIGAFAQAVFSSDALPDLSWFLHASARLSGIGEKVRPVACGDVFRRIIGGTFCRQYSSALEDFFQPLGQYGVSVRGGVELVAEQAAIGHQRGGTVLAFDGVNAFNSMRRAHMLPALAKIVPPVARYASNLYARTPPKLLFSMEDGQVQVVQSRRGVQQGCNLGPLCYSAGGLDLLREFRQTPPVEGAQIMAYIDDVVVILPPDQARNMSAVAEVTQWLQTRLQTQGVALNRQKSKVLLPGGYGPESLSREEQTILTSTRLAVACGGMRVVGVPVGTVDFQQKYVRDTMRGEPAALVRALVPLEDAQASFQILRLSAASRMSFLLRTLLLKLRVKPRRNLTN